MYSVARKVAGQPRPHLNPPGLWWWSSGRLNSIRRRPYATAQLDLPALDIKWRRQWKREQNAEARLAKLGAIDPSISTEKKKKEKKKRRADHMHILPMFPYPSGNLHLGHLRVYTIADVIARFRRLQGKDVMLPMGWDAFGLPAENAAIERGIDPAVWTKDNIARMKEQLEYMNGSFDWSREFATCDPEFYKHTQRIFLLLHRNGLVSQKNATVNWDPVDNTVLANEQVDSEGRSWRSGAKVEQRELKQWFFHITEFKESLERDLETLANNGDWPERVLTMQKNWLGHTRSALYKFPAFKLVSLDQPEAEEFEVYTTRPETVFAAQFIALSPDSPIVNQMKTYDPELKRFLDQIQDLPPDATEGYLAPNDEARSPLEELIEDPVYDQDNFYLPVYVAPYVRGDYGTGAIMGVPGHDARDYAFFQRHRPDVPIRYAITPNPSGSLDYPLDHDGPYLGRGYMTYLGGPYYKMPSDDVAQEIVERVATEEGLAEVVHKWKIRDWLISRQRYWGTPIPIIHCDSCGPVPVPDEDLPVTLPKVDHHWKNGRAGNPLETATGWVNVSCPRCKGPARRDTDTMDTFVDSSWYYMRFADPDNSEQPLSEKEALNHLPVELYIGGVEHAILHLLYARFMYKAVIGLLFPDSLRVRVPWPPGELKPIDWDDPAEPLSPEETAKRVRESTLEPFERLITQGMVHGKTYKDPGSGQFLKPEEVDLSDPSNPKVVASGQSATVTFEKMSKSKHNGVDPTTFITKYGADATRAHILFQAPVGEVLNWDEDKIAGITRWLRRVYAYVKKLGPLPLAAHKLFKGAQHFNIPQDALKRMSERESIQWESDVEVWRTTQNTITIVTDTLEKVYTLNTMISMLMTMTNTLLDKTRASTLIKQRAAAVLLRLMAPITPALSEECWRMLFPSAKSIFDEESGGWPVPDNSLPFLETADKGGKCAVQVNGSLRCVVEIPPLPTNGKEDPESTGFQKWLTAQILEHPEAQKKLQGGNDIRHATKMFVIQGGRVVNFVVPKPWP
ncbi:leucyl-tRNA synthetase [Xylariaceae sp. FL0662B]|nr:leucyl-tRNA synthetase [Xylariaceae sp. FL0662B]